MFSRLFEDIYENGKKKNKDDDLNFIYKTIYESKNLNEIGIAIKILFEVMKNKINNEDVKAITKQYLSRLKDLFEGDDVLNNN
jgi:hypothetical protein